MPYSTSSGASSPGRFSSGSESGDIDTPFTERSILFDDHDIDVAVQQSVNDQHILVVGGCGFIGSHTVWELAKAGYNVVIIDNLSNAFSSVFDRLETMVTHHYETVKPGCRQPSLKLYEADFRDTETLTKILESYETPLGFRQHPNDEQRSTISGVIHFAAYKAVGESIKQPLKYYANNVGGLIDFCDLLSDFGIRNFVFSSSATVYGTVADIGVPLREEYCSQETTVFIDEDDQKKVVQAGCSGLTNPYGRTKWMCEAILNDLAHADPSWTITALRYFNPIGCDESGLLGEDPRTAATNLMPVVLRVLTGEAPALNIYGDDYDTPDGTAVRDYIHVTDLARGHLAALKSRADKGFRVYNLGSGRGHSVLDLVAAMEQVSQRKIPTQLVGRREGDVGMCVAKAGRAQEELGWRTEKTLETCCRDVWRFLEHVVAEDSRAKI
ncbi:UDP-glucose 4-epimerase [Lachnellula suecica]|uniref:UDP-glucose 4-epimerase n=1 Tax=Lachnellula suecica TaxID=602035 RepID=A0A8T9CGR5_9HELO|nr:UDP-glucose 4-epimerase [Lachnellula suecica]